MASAVENASVVLICFSETYKNSPSCRTGTHRHLWLFVYYNQIIHSVIFLESEYTYKLRKEYVPVRMQPCYNPDGWLGILLGTKLYYDLSTEELFAKNINTLVKELQRKGIEDSEAFVAVQTSHRTSGTVCYNFAFIHTLLQRPVLTLKQYQTMILTSVSLPFLNHNIQVHRK